jgi:hypothetical protein
MMNWTHLLLQVFAVAAGLALLSLHYFFYRWARQRTKAELQAVKTNASFWLIISAIVATFLIAGGASGLICASQGGP